MYKSTKCSHIIKTTGHGFWFAGVIWLSLLLFGARAFRDSTEASYDVVAGPLVLNTFTREMHASSQNISIAFGTGIIWLLVGGAICGCLVGILLFIRSKNHKQ